MKIKRYLDKDMRHVLRRVREDQGPDAVILSNRRVDDGIEVIAAIDYDEALVRSAMGVAADADAGINSDILAEIAEDDIAEDNIAPPTERPVEIVSADLSQQPVDDASLKALQNELSSMRGLLETQLSGLVWKDASRRFPLRAQVLRNLASLGMAPDIANLIVTRLEPTDDIKSLWSAPLTALAQTLPVMDDDLLQTGGTIALIGPTGVGKTTTIAKIAARFAMDSWSDDIALVSADSYRIGAKEHLSAFANIIGAKVYSASSFDELSETLTRLKDKKLVLIDTEGRSQRDRDLSSRLAAYGRNADRVSFYLTLSAATQEAALDETVREFSKVPLKGCIVTKIDEAAQLGCVMSALIRNDLPAAWFSDGQRIPDDLHSAARKKLWLVNQAVECMEASHPRIDERTMAEDYSRQGFANAQ
ncbi:MAG: flagellar biosynthesis protein FlhF [Gammaproteobacteria bacterium]|nr:flagellar biosynthesis protein FlhF [Gammaproteobacteria bacterium]